MPSFFFVAHNHKVNGPKTNNDSDITLQVDESQREYIAPFALISPNTQLKVTIEYEWFMERVDLRDKR